MDVLIDLRCILFKSMGGLCFVIFDRRVVIDGHATLCPSYGLGGHKTEEIWKIGFYEPGARHFFKGPAPDWALPGGEGFTVDIIPFLSFTMKGIKKGKLFRTESQK